jgi:pyruvate kinase
MALSTKAPAIVVLTRSGSTAMAVSAFRPMIPILAFTPSAEIAHPLELVHGIVSLSIPFGDSSPKENVDLALKTARERGLIEAGTTVVVISDTREAEQTIHTVHLRTVA